MRNPWSIHSFADVARSSRPHRTARPLKKSVIRLRQFWTPCISLSLRAVVLTAVWATAWTVAWTTIALLSLSQARAESSEESSGDSESEHTHSRGGGSRGCSQWLNESADLNLSTLPRKAPAASIAASGADDWPGPTPSSQPALALLTTPDGRVQTRSTRPSFAWYVHESRSMPLEFRIYRQPRLAEPTSGSGMRLGQGQAVDPADAELVIELAHEAFVSRPGIMTLALPESVPPLLPGETYWWQVEMQCDPADPSSNIFAEARLEILSASAPPQRYERLEAMLNAELQAERHPDETDAISASLAHLLRTEMGVSETVAAQLHRSSVHAISSQIWPSSLP